MQHSILNRVQRIKHYGYPFTDTDAAVLVGRDTIYWYVRLLE